MGPQNYSPMPMPAPVQPRPRRPLLIIVLSIIGVLVIGGGTLLALSLFRQSAETPTPETTALKEVALPDVLLASYIDTAMGDRGELYEQRDATEPGTNDGQVDYQDQPQSATTATNGLIVYKASGSYETRVTSLDYVQYARTSTSERDNSASVATATDGFLTSKGLVKSGTDDSITGVTYTNYDSANVFCQVSDFKGTDLNPAAYGLNCVLKSVITAQYSFMNDLLGRYPSASEKGTPKSVYQSTPIIENDKQLVILSVAYESDATTLIFGAIGNEWEYVGERAVPNPDDEESFSISTQLQTAINDPKWGGFLTKYVK